MLQGTPTRSGRKARRKPPARVPTTPVKLLGATVRIPKAQTVKRTPGPQRLSGPRGDAPQRRGMQRAEQYKQTRGYAQSVRAAYGSLPLADRKRRAAQAKVRVGTPKEQPNDRAIVREHNRRLGRNQQLARQGPQGLPGPHVTLPASMLRPTPPKHHGGLHIGIPVSALDLALRVAGRSNPVRSAEHAVSRELAGGGNIAKIVGDYANWVAKNGVGISTGGGPATLAAGKGARRRSPILASARPYRVKDAPPIVTNAIKDAINFPAQAPAALFVPAAGAVEALHGRPQRLKQFAKDVKRTDPVVNLVTGHPGKALKLAGEHPGFTALEVAGLKGMAGRGVGRVTMAAGKHPTLPDRVVPHTNIVERRPPTGDYITDRTRLAVERRKGRGVAKLRQQADAADGQGLHRKAAGLREEANYKDPARVKDTEIRRRADERVGLNELTRRQDLSRTLHEGDKALGKKPTAAVTLATQNIANDRAGLIAYRERIKGEARDLHGPDLRQNRETRALIDDALKSHDSVKVKAAAERYAGVMNARTRGLAKRGLLAKAQAERRPLEPYAVEHMGAKSEGDRLVAANGATLTDAQIRAHMGGNDRNLADPAYVSQARSSRGSQNFYRNATAPPAMSRARFTGLATKLGTHDAHPEVLREGLARAQNLISAADGWARGVHEVALRGENGKPRTFTRKSQADKVAEQMSEPGGTQFKAVRLTPFTAKHEQLAYTLDNTQHSRTIARTIEQAAEGADGAGNWGIVPSAWADQLVKHTRTTGATDFQKAFQATSQTFRRTVLATSLPWLTGNASEASLRAALYRAGPGSYRLASGALKQIRKEDGPALEQEIRNRTTGGGHMALAGRKTYRGAELFSPDSKLGKTAAAIGAAKQAPGVRHITDAWDWYAGKVFNSVNGPAESIVQTAMLGRSLKNAGYKAVEDAANGLRDTNNQVRFAREVERAYGKYNAFSPDARAALATYTPFAAWTWNAVKFAASVLPLDHPVVTTLIVASERANEDWLKAKGRNQFAPGAVPGFLQTTLPLSNGSSLPLGRYTPAGAFGDLAGTAGQAVLPQFSGVLAASRGEDWKGKKLLKPDGEPADLLGKTKAAALAFTQSTVPLVGTVQNVARKGPLGALNPYTPIRPKQGTSSGGAAGGSISKSQKQKLIREARMSGGATSITEDQKKKLIREARLAAGR